MTIDQLPKVIGLTGRMYAGKTTVADFLVQKYGYKKLAFADALKQMLVAAGMCTVDECYGKKTEQSRWLLQKIGTEIFRKQVHADFWVQQTAKKVIELLGAGGRVVVDDIRFPNEAKLVHAYMGTGLLVRVSREYIPFEEKAAAGIDGHESEALVDSLPVDADISAQSGDTEDLCAQMDAVLAGRLK